MDDYFKEENTRFVATKQIIQYDKIWLEFVSDQTTLHNGTFSPSNSSVRIMREMACNDEAFI